MPPSIRAFKVDTLDKLINLVTAVTELDLRVDPGEFVRECFEAYFDLSPEQRRAVQESVKAGTEKAEE